MSSPESLPQYAGVLEAYHWAFQGEFDDILAELPIEDAALVLDVPCGDGFFTRRIAARQRFGQTIGVDVSPAFLEVAHDQVSSTGRAPYWLQGDCLELPIRSNSVDLIWCAHSLISLTDTVSALKEMHRVLRPGGTIAVLEHDQMHRWLLPWPANLELAVQDAERQYFLQKHGSTRKMYNGRHLHQLLSDTEFRVGERHTMTAERQQPMDKASLHFFYRHFADLRRRIGPYIPHSRRSMFDTFTDPHSPDFLPTQADFVATAIEILQLGMK
ncbi:MAG: class I SAM-dependent methyltransferase [Pirellulaceae bacterium]